MVPRVHTQKTGLHLQNEDKRIVFVIPWMDEFSIIGTTDVEYKGDPKAVAIDDNEVNYLLNVYNAHFKKPLTRDDIVWTYSGVRRCATMNPTRRRRSPAITRLISMMIMGRRRCCRSLAAS